ncbi:putative proteasome subunit alpha type-3 [Astathelohania contejeani]|uniref:Proteasome subunit alpha type-3 n=1 Tax=Astathelohania contejeani TaxID=164912 RepID=A0ABQ7HZP0_9MICR|nr:putative proteasome subunit alpha type-3 [Thelohania contejeani]
MISSDNKTNTFTEEGRILQVEYAIKNVSKGGTIIGMVCQDGVILMGLKKGSIQKQNEKIYKISNEIYSAICGTFSDALQLIGYGRLKAQEFQEEMDAPIPLSTFCRQIGELKQAFTQGGGMRLFGVSLLYAGMMNGEYCLYSTDPSGTYTKWKAMAYGENEDAINSAFKNDLPNEEMNMERGFKEILKILVKVRECGRKDVPKMEILFYNSGKNIIVEEEYIYKIFDELSIGL